VLDRVEGVPGEHHIEQFWHFGAPVRQCGPHCFQVGSKALIAFDETLNPRLFEGGDFGWISPALGAKLPGAVVCAEQRASLPGSFTTLIDLSGNYRTLQFQLHPNQLGADCIYDDGPPVPVFWNS